MPQNKRQAIDAMLDLHKDVLKRAQEAQEMHDQSGQDATYYESLETFLTDLAGEIEDYIKEMIGDLSTARNGGAAAQDNRL